MKKILKGPEPQLLNTYRIKNPQGTWERFKNSDARKLQVQQALKSDQGGICAYCEIDLREQNTAANTADFRVEHFHPKSDTMTPYNWALDWCNLLGCCHGGSNSDVVDAAARFSSPDNSCDVPKGNKILDSIILNPLNIPALPPIFNCDRASGVISVNSNNCQHLNVDLQKAKNTIVELRLDAERLNKFRSAALNKVNQLIQIRIEQHESLGDARSAVAKSILKKDSNGHWPPFFTSIVSYLGHEAIEHLQESQYDG